MDPRPDFVLVFSLEDKYSPVRAFGEISESKLKADRAKQVQEEYEKLVARLKACDLEATGRKGAEGTDTILILVRGKEKRILEEVTRERMSDFLHNVCSETRPSPRSPRDFVDEPVQETERIRAVYGIMTAPRFKATTSVRSPAVTGLTCGIPIILPAEPQTKVDFPHLIAMFPPHNVTFNNAWQKRWMNLSTATSNSKNPLELLSIPQNELDDLKAHLGGKTALYFAFLCFYFKSLLFPSAIGGLFWILGLSFHPVLGVAFTCWSLLMVESWRLRERALSVHWGSYGAHKVEVQRAGFRGDGLEVDPVTGVTQEKWGFRKTLTRSLASLPVYFAFVGILAAIIGTIYMVETVLGEVYNGPGKKVFVMLPTVLFVSIVPQVTGFWQFIATKLTDFENHPYQTEYDTSLTIKLFALNFVASYGNLLLTSFVYIPFGAFLVPHIFNILPSRHAHAIAGSAIASIQSGEFVIDTHKLKRQLVAYTLTAQITGAFTEIGLPYLKARFGPQIAEKLNAKGLVKNKAGPSPVDEEKMSLNDSEDEKVFLERIRREQLLPPANLGGEYAEMATQLGYICMFAVCWPLAPIWSLVNNFFEIRGDAFKLANQTRRPVPAREATIGPWLDVLGFITYLGTLTTSALVYLYQPQVTYKGVSAEYLSNVTHHNVSVPTNGTVPFWSTRLSIAQSAGSPPPDSPLLMGALPAAPTSITSLDSIKTLLVTALLVAMLSSHGYLVLRGVARWLLERLQWDGSLPHQIVRKGELELKRAWLDENEMRMGPKDMVKKCMAWENEERKRRNGTDQEEENGSGNTVTNRVEEEMRKQRKSQDDEDQYLVGRTLGKSELSGTDGEEFWKREDEGGRVVGSLKKTE